MRKRATLARSLIYEPETLLLDEPFAAVDAIVRTSLHEMLLQLWERAGMTVIFVTHDLEEALLLGRSGGFLVQARPDRPCRAGLARAAARPYQVANRPRVRRDLDAAVVLSRRGPRHPNRRCRIAWRDRGRAFD